MPGRSIAAADSGSPAEINTGFFDIGNPVRPSMSLSSVTLSYLHSLSFPGLGLEWDEKAVDKYAFR